MKWIRNLVTSPVFLSLIPFLVIIIFIPFRFSKYLLKTESEITLEKDTYVWHNDLDNDGLSEKLAAFDKDNSTGITISNINGVIDQWNMKGSFGFASKRCLFITGDKENDGKKEVYIFTLLSDSILMHCISDLKSGSFSFENRLVAVAGKGIKGPDPYIIPAEMDDLDGDGIKELIFGIGSGFSHYPRNVYAYYISKDSLAVSPESSYFIFNIVQFDIDNDGEKEIMPYGYAASNVAPENALYHDHSSFLIVLDQNLNFRFSPLEFRGKYGGLTPFAKTTDTGNSLAVLYNPPSEKSKSRVYSVNSDGTISDSLQLPFNAISCLSISDTSTGNVEYIFSGSGKEIALYSDDFKLLKLLKTGAHVSLKKLDIDADGGDEIVMQDKENEKLVIYRPGLANPVSADIELSDPGESIITLNTTDSSGPVISVQTGQRHYYIRYSLNPAFPFYFLYYPLIYLFILGFALLIRNVQKNQMKRKYETEKKISELQLALVRNQLDPHFTLNVINSIIYSIETSNKRKAGDGLRRFANLYRNLLMSAGSTQSKISEELDFCNDYLLLEKMRFGDKFNFHISISDDVSRDALIPKLIIQIHAENAVKHGLSEMESGGLLDIDLRLIENELRIIITDNGIGREESGKQKKISTGKGLGIMDELYSVYNRIYDDKVSSEIIDLFNEDGSAAGTRVIIRIRRKNE